MDSQILAFDSSLSLTDSVIGIVQTAVHRRQPRVIEHSRAPVRQIAILATLILLISFVSVYDVYWSFKTRDVLPEMELNPVGYWLIELDGGDISLFMTCKMVGTMLVILSVPALYAYKRHWGMACATGLAVFQSMLFLYLNFGHMLPYFHLFSSGN